MHADDDGVFLVSADGDGVFESIAATTLTLMATFSLLCMISFCMNSSLNRPLLRPVREAPPAPHSDIESGGHAPHSSSSTEMLSTIQLHHDQLMSTCEEMRVLIKAQNTEISKQQKSISKLEESLCAIASGEAMEMIVKRAECWKQLKNNTLRMEESKFINALEYIVKTDFVRGEEWVKTYLKEYMSTHSVKEDDAVNVSIALRMIKREYLTNKDNIISTLKHNCGDKWVERVGEMVKSDTWNKVIMGAEPLDF